MLCQSRLVNRHHNVKVVENQGHLHFLLGFLAQGNVPLRSFLNVTKWYVLVVVIDASVLGCAGKVVEEEAVAISLGNKLGEKLGCLNVPLSFAQSEALRVAVLAASQVLLNRDSVLEGHGVGRLC